MDATNGIVRRKKLIEVALPLEAINIESKRDKKLSSGHPTTLHYWWAPRPLPACRAVVFAALVDDPSSRPDQFPDEDSQDSERERLFALMRELIRWESRRDGRVLEAARLEIESSTNGHPPTLLDPFCGRGLIPLEGQRLGLDVLAADVNPVAVLIAKTLLETIPRFMFHRAVNPVGRDAQFEFSDSTPAGFAADLKHYASLVLERVGAQLRHHFPNYEITPELVERRPDLKSLVGANVTVMGWLWARTVCCSNPACRATIPLVGSFWLSQKPRRKYWLEPEIDPSRKKIRFLVRSGNGRAPSPTKLPDTSATFRCLACGENSRDKYLEQEGKAGRIGKVLMACIADGGRSYGRVYLPATDEHERIALSAKPKWRPDMPVPPYSQAMPTAKHGVNTWADFFTDRQLLVLETLAEGVRSIHETVERDAKASGLPDDEQPLERGGTGARAYADAVVALLGLVLGKQANRTCAFSFWHSGRENIEQPFAQQGFQKSWDFVESNPFSEKSGSWLKAVEYPAKVIGELYADIKPGRAVCQPATSKAPDGSFMIITDPPYYDQIGYADLSDFFYIWERRALTDIYPELFATVLTPKGEEPELVNPDETAWFMKLVSRIAAG